MYAEHGKHPREALFYAVSRVVLIVYIIRRDMHSASIMYLFTSENVSLSKTLLRIKKNAVLYTGWTKNHEVVSSLPRDTPQCILPCQTDETLLCRFYLGVFQSYGPYDDNEWLWMR